MLRIVIAAAACLCVAAAPTPAAAQGYGGYHAGTHAGYGYYAYPAYYTYPAYYPAYGYYGYQAAPAYPCPPKAAATKTDDLDTLIKELQVRKLLAELKRDEGKKETAKTDKADPPALTPEEVEKLRKILNAK